MALEGRAHVVEAVRRELARVVELVVIQAAEALHGAAHPLHGRLARVLGLIAAGDEAGYHRPKGPDSE